LDREAIITAAYSRLARSDRVVALATRLRGLTTGLLGHRLAEGIDFERNGEAWLASVAAPHSAVVVDVGANTGEWAAMFLSGAQAEVALLFEPSASAHRELAERFAGTANVEVVNAAVADQSGELPFFEEEGSGETSSLAPGIRLAPGIERTVPVTTLDEELGRREVAHVDFCKIDAEGFDLRVMKGARSYLEAQRIDLVQFEYNAAWANAGSTLADALTMLAGHGYEVFLLKRRGLYRFEYARFGELFTYANFLAVAPRRRDLVTPYLTGAI
jgi:FkbM family methyltransferase